VLHKLNSAATLIQRTTHGGSSMTNMNYIGLDVHKKTISYGVKDAAGHVLQEGKVGSTRRELDCWIKTLPQPRTIAMEATIFTGWIYNHLLPHAEKVKVAHPLMLRAIAAAKKKNDTIDAGKIADCLRCDFLPECYMVSTEIRDRRRTLRYRHLLVRQMVQMKNRVSGLLMETGVEHNKQRLHKVGYFHELLSTQPEVPHPTVAEDQPGYDRAVSEDRVCPGQFSSARSDPGRSNQAAQNDSWSWAHYCPDVGPGDRSVSHASSRSSRPSAIVGSAARSEAPRTSWFECPSPNKGTSTFSRFSWRLRN
jgi:transposase